MNYTIIKIGGKGFKSYYFPVAGFLEQGHNIKVVALGKRVQMAAYLCSIIQKHGARIIDVRLSTVELPPSKVTTGEKPVDVVMIEVFIERNMFVSRIQPDSERHLN